MGLNRFFTLVSLLMLLSTYTFCVGRTSRSEEDQQENFLMKKKLHELKALTQKAAKKLADLTDYSTFYTSYLQNLLRVRVPGTVGHHEVQKFIIKTLKDYNWNVELDEFTEETPLGKKNFTNIIATLDPNADRRLALVAHYDSKLLEPKNGKYFIAATDSAVPCAMLLDFAKLLSTKTSDKRSKVVDNVTPMLLFLDGEEAFEEWTSTDSIYGARHLATNFQEQPHHNKALSEKSINMLDAIDAFVLFDLIGAANPQFLNLHPATSPLYNRLQQIENELKKLGKIDNSRPYFPGAPRSPLAVEDDHIPFLRKGVPVLHLISIPFPDVWHKLSDDESALDPKSIENLLKIFRQFILEYFHLSN